MDYKKAYNLKYSDTKETIKQDFLASLKKGNIKGFQFFHSYKLLIEELTNKLDGIRVKYLESEYKKVYKVFKGRLGVYDKDNLLNTLNNETLDEFNCVGNLSLLKYDEFVDNLAFYESIKDSLEIINDNYKLYDIMFQADDYKNFIFEFIKGELIESKIFQNEYKRLYPKAKIYKIGGNVDNIRNILVEPNRVNVADIKIKENPELTKYDKIVLGDIKIYSEKDKVLLLYSVKYALENQIKISAIEFSRVLLICKVDDLALFQDNYKNSTTYKKISSGLKYSYAKKLDKIDAISELQIKNEKFGFKDINNVFVDMLEKEVHKVKN